MRRRCEERKMWGQNRDDDLLTLTINMKTGTGTTCIAYRQGHLRTSINVIDIYDDDDGGDVVHALPLSVSLFLSLCFSVCRTDKKREGLVKKKLMTFCLFQSISPSTTHPWGEERGDDDGHGTASVSWFDRRWVKSVICSRPEARINGRRWLIIDCGRLRRTLVVGGG